MYSVLIIFVTAFLAIGCAGNGSSSVDCDTLTTEFLACGGDLQGRWTIDKSCLASVKGNHILFMACPSTTLTAEVHAEGVLNIDAEHFTPEFTLLDLPMHLGIPMACLQTMSLDCAYVEQQLNEDPGTEATCQVEGEHCRCDAVMDLLSVWTGQLPYSQQSATSFLVEDPDGYEYVIPYCRDGDKGTVKVDFYTDTGSAEVYFVGHK